MTASMLSRSSDDPARNSTLPAAKLDNVTLSIGDKCVLDRASVTLQSGLIHGILGRGGSGRTTLLKVVATLLNPDSGTVTVLGTDVFRDDGQPESVAFRCPPDELTRVRSKIGFQFQNLGLFDSLSALDNVLFSLTEGMPENASDADVARAVQMLRLVGLDNAGEKSVSQLSGGMQRRLAIARAFAPTRTKIVMFDDPTGGLDPVTASRILQLVTTPDSSKTVILTSHETGSLMATCDMIHVISNGRIVFSGTPEAALKSTDAAVMSLVH